MSILANTPDNFNLTLADCFKKIRIMSSADEWVEQVRHWLLQEITQLPITCNPIVNEIHFCTALHKMLDKQVVIRRIQSHYIKHNKAHIFECCAYHSNSRSYFDVIFYKS